MNESRKNHFWIPEEEVIPVDKKLTSRSKDYNVQFSEHGAKLSSALKDIKTLLDQNQDEDSLSQLDLIVFKVALAKGEKIQDKDDLFNSHGLSVNAVKTENQAVVSTSKSRFQRLMKNVENYTSSGRGKTTFDIIDNFETYSGQEKNSSSLRKTMCSREIPETIDIQLMLLPNMSEEEYLNILNNLKVKLGESQKTVYKLSDDTPIIRAVISPSSLVKFEKDSAIYRIEETDFFTVPSNVSGGEPIENFKLSPDIDLNTLPTVVVLDNGIRFPEFFEDLIVEHWAPQSTSKGNCSHGTRVASLIAFRYFPLEGNPELVPRAKIVDCNILDDNIPINEFISRIQSAVNRYAKSVCVFNLSANSLNPIEGTEMSILGYELDVLQQNFNIQFVVSAGNHQLWRYGYTLEDILDDDDSIIASPADSMLSIVVGATAGVTHKNCVSKKNQIVPYGRRGPGFKGFSKPDMTAYAGVIAVQDGGIPLVPVDNYSLSLSKDGILSPDAGTSFSAPIVSGDFAEILKTTGNNPLLAKALLYHNADPLWDESEMQDDDLRNIHNFYGRGLSNVEKSKYSTPSRVTFLRTGILSRTKKERIKFFMPEILAAQQGRNVARVSLTCVSAPSVDRTKGTEYLGSYVRVSMKKAGEDENALQAVPPLFHEGHQKWDVCSHISRVFSNFNAGDWQAWLELFSRWDYKEDDVPYALVVTIEDLSGELNIYQEIENLNRFKTSAPVRARV